MKITIFTRTPWTVLLLGMCLHMGPGRAGQIHAAALAGDPEKPAAPAPVLPQWQVTYSGVTQSRFVVCRDGAAWVRAWQDMGQDPPVHLATNLLGVAIFAGQRPTGGYSLEVLSAKVIDTNYVITCKESAPRGMVTEALTTPAVFAIVPWSTLTLKLTEEKTVVEEKPIRTSPGERKL